MEDGNVFLQSYIRKHNEKFKREAIDPTDAHIPLSPEDRIDKQIRWEVSRRLSATLVLHYNKIMFILEETPLTRKLAGSYVLVCEYPSGEVEIEHNGVTLPYRIFDKMRRIHQPEVVDSKRLSAALDLARKIQESSPHARKRNKDAPVRVDNVQSIFDPPEQKMNWSPSSIDPGGSTILRTVSRQRSFSYKSFRLVLNESEASRDAIGKKIEIKEHPDGRIEALYRGCALPFSWPAGFAWDE
jgi:hypothetical protein